MQPEGHLQLSACKNHAGAKQMITFLYYVMVVTDYSA